jgi:hypothetical protein
MCKYTGLMATTWDRFRGDTCGWEDCVIWRDVMRAHGRPGLDMGCGSCRLLPVHMSDRVDSDSVDSSPKMLAPSACQQPLEPLALPRWQYAHGLPV